MSNEYLDIAMEKVIKQEVDKVLEQIRYEIEQSWDGYLLTDNQSFEGVPSICINHALDIIDKYREDKE